MFQSLTTKALLTATTTGAVVLSVLASGSAQAAQVFNFRYSFPGAGGSPTPVSASGTLTTTDNLDPNTNAYTITGITGTRIFNGVTQQITGLLPPNAYGNNDNLLYPNSPFLSNLPGFSFTVDGTGNFENKVNVYYVASRNAYTELSNSIGDGIFEIIPATAIPTPALLPGMIGLGVAAWRKRKSEAANEAEA